MGNESQKSQECRTQSNVKSDLLKVGAIDATRLEQYATKTRDNPSLAVYRDTLSKVIFIDDFYIGNQEYVTGEYRNISRSPVGVGEQDYEDLIDSERRFSKYRQLFVGKRICDFGCGKGGFLNRVSNVAKSACGVELQQHYSEMLNASGINCYSNLSDVPEAPDVVTLFHCFEHLPSPIASLEEIFRKLKPNGDGTVLIEVPNARDFLIEHLSLQSFVEFTLWSQHLILHTRESLASMLAAAGFKSILIESVQRYGIANHFHWMLNQKPGGHKSHLSILETTELSSAYALALAKIDATDTLVAIAKT